MGKKNLHTCLPNPASSLMQHLRSSQEETLHIRVPSSGGKQKSGPESNVLIYLGRLPEGLISVTSACRQNKGQSLEAAEKRDNQDVRATDSQADNRSKRSESFLRSYF